MKEEFALNTVISGSYRKHLKEMLLLKEYLMERGIGVSAPTGTAAVNLSEEFIILESDPIEDPRLLQDSIFAMMRRATFHAVMNKDGYIGKAALLEFGYAVALGLQILTVERVTDPNLAVYCRYIGDVFPDWEKEKHRVLQTSPVAAELKPVATTA